MGRYKFPTPNSKSAEKKAAREKEQHKPIHCAVCEATNVQLLKIKEPVEIDDRQITSGYICVWCKDEVKK